MTKKNLWAAAKQRGFLHDFYKSYFLWNWVAGQSVTVSHTITIGIGQL